MAWFGIACVFACMFCCLGMVQQQQQQQQTGFLHNFRRNFNIVYFLCNAQQRAITVLVRNKYGTQALGAPCGFGLLLIFLWWMFSHDEVMMYYMGVWVLFYLFRRVEAVRLSSKIHSHYDGWPVNLGSDERKAKEWYEPICVAILGFIALKWYEAQGWNPIGLPYFLLSGAFSCRFVAWVNMTAWQKKIQAMNDAQIDNRIALRDFEDQFGN